MNPAPAESTIALSPLTGWPGRLVLLLGLTGLLGGCAAWPARAPATAAPTPAPVAAAASARQVAQAVAPKVQAHAPGRRLDAAARTRLVERLAAEGGDDLRRHLAAMAAEPDVRLYAGNTARLLADGPQTFAAMFAAIAAARRSVLVETYIVDDAAIAERLAELLVRKRREGLEVALLYDAVGSMGTDDAYFQRLRDAGVAVCAFNPLSGERPTREPQAPTQRDHRKIVAVDGVRAFTGGINISGVYRSGSFGRGSGGSRADADDSGWRDTHLALRGPAAAALDALVRSTWRAQHCEPALQPPRPPEAAGRHGDRVVRIVEADPQAPFNRIYTTLMTAIEVAQRRIWITMAYFAPGTEMVEALADAARRGVDVQLVLPSRSDFSPVLHAGRSHYDQLLAAGVQVHELQPSVLHAKTAVIDGVLSSVGSSNLDFRSLVGNNEVNAVILDAEFGAAMERMFAEDVRVSRTITLQAWRDRSWWQRAREGVARLFEPLL